MIQKSTNWLKILPKLTENSIKYFKPHTERYCSKLIPKLITDVFLLQPQITIFQILKTEVFSIFVSHLFAAQKNIFIRVHILFYEERMHTT